MKRYDFISEYGPLIDQTLRRLESANGGLKLPVISKSKEACAANDLSHLSRHLITEAGRARMIDWMFEVLNTFKMSEQTFFLSVQYLDRYIA